MNQSTLFHPSPRRWMNKKTQERMDRIKRESRFVKPQERGVAARVEAELIAGTDPLDIACKLGISADYVLRIKEAIERRK